MNKFLQGKILPKAQMLRQRLKAITAMKAQGIDVDSDPEDGHFFDGDEMVSSILFILQYNNIIYIYI